MNKHKLISALMSVVFLFSVISLSFTVYSADTRDYSGQFTDVCIDSAGALAGLLILAGCLALGRKIRKSKEKKALEKKGGDGPES